MYNEELMHPSDARLPRTVPRGIFMLPNQKEVDVVFRPLSSEVYDDVILFKVLDGPNAGGFNVPVRALLPTLQVRQLRMSCRAAYID